MNSRRETEELIEQYVTGNLNTEEKRIFEAWLESDAAMAKAVQDHQLLLKTFELYSDRSALRQRSSHCPAPEGNPQRGLRSASRA